MLHSSEATHVMTSFEAIVLNKEQSHELLKDIFLNHTAIENPFVAYSQLCTLLWREAQHASRNPVQSDTKYILTNNHQKIDLKIRLVSNIF